MRIIEELPSPVLGPMTVMKLGKPLAVAPRSAAMPSFQLSASVCPSAPTTRSAIGMSVTWKPVPKTIASTSAVEPSAATRVLPRISLSPEATRSTFGRARAG